MAAPVGGVDALARNDALFMDRIGFLGGVVLHLQPEGAPASFAERSLPEAALAAPHSQYAFIGFLPKGWSIGMGEVAPWFDQPGGAIMITITDQEHRPVTIHELINKKVLIPR